MTINNESWKDIDIGTHWRHVVCVLIGTNISTVIWHQIFLNVFWFDIFWAGSVTGGTVGLLVGSIWHHCRVKPHQKSPRRFIVLLLCGWSLFSAFAIFVDGPDFTAQEHERAFVRNWDKCDIRSISIVPNNALSVQVVSGVGVKSFVELAKNAELFTPSHETSTDEFLFNVRFSNGSTNEYKARIPKRHTNDISLQFRAYLTLQEIIIPGGAVWLHAMNNAR